MPNSIRIGYLCFVEDITKTILVFFMGHSVEVGPLNPARGSGERCKLPQRGLGRSSRNRIWCILALKSDICVRRSPFPLDYTTGFYVDVPKDRYLNFSCSPSSLYCSPVGDIIAKHSLTRLHQCALSSYDVRLCGSLVVCPSI